jgi:hypothetical protein
MLLRESCLWNGVQFFLRIVRAKSEFHGERIELQFCCIDLREYFSFEVVSLCSLLR